MLPRVSSRVSGFPVASPCLWGRLQNMSFSKVSKQVEMLFCAALCDIPTCLMTYGKNVLCGRRSTFASFSKDELQFSWQAQHVGDLCCHFAWQAQRFRRVALRALHSALHTLQSSLYRGSWATLYTPHSTLHSPPFTLHTPHFTFHTLHTTLRTLHSTL